MVLYFKFIINLFNKNLCQLPIGVSLTGNAVWALSIPARIKRSIGTNQDPGKHSLIKSFHLPKQVLFSVSNMYPPHLEKVPLELLTHSDAC